MSRDYNSEIRIDYILRCRHCGKRLLFVKNKTYICANKECRDKGHMYQLDEKRKRLWYIGKAE